MAGIPCRCPAVSRRVADGQELSSLQPEPGGWGVGKWSFRYSMGQAECSAQGSCLLKGWCGAVWPWE